jgi:hypothetical protein
VQLFDTTHTMKKESLYKEISDAVQSLLEMARASSFNNISDNCKFIISEIKRSDKNFFEQNKIRKTVNDRKTSKPLTDIIVELEMLYSNLYDVNLYVYKADKHLTVIEIQYFLRSSLDIGYQKLSATQETMLHCKVAIPAYASDNKKKFDINWQLGTINHNWKIFWWQRKTRKYLESRKVKI